MNYPKILCSKNNFSILIDAVYESNTTTKEIDCALDLDQFGNLIAIEILSLQFHLGTECLNKIKKHISTSREKQLRYAYDEDSDSFYLKLVNERSLDQKPEVAAITLDAEGAIIKISVSGIDMSNHKLN